MAASAATSAAEFTGYGVHARRIADVLLAHHRLAAVRGNQRVGLRLRQARLGDRVFDDRRRHERHAAFDRHEPTAVRRENEPIEGILRDAYFVPETKPAAELLKSMQTNHYQFAVVIDEYGGVAGIVTVEDILEEIVGDIQDEYDSEEELIHLQPVGGVGV